jgi:phospholipid transport system substrate-binding protein
MKRDVLVGLLVSAGLLASVGSAWGAPAQSDAAQNAVDKPMPAAIAKKPVATEAAAIRNPRIAAVVAATRSESAEQAVDLATKQMLDLIKEGQAYVEQDPERFYVEVEALFSPLIDFPRFARNVMGVYYKQADTAQREGFAESFKWSLVRTYALALTEFHNGQVAVLEPRQKPRDPDKVNVTQEIVYQGKTYVVVYRMQRKKEQWQLQNLIIEGVNVGLNYKSQFAAAMKDPQYGGDLDAVIDAWTKFIEQDSAAEEPTAAAN